MKFNNGSHVHVHLSDYDNQVTVYQISNAFAYKPDTIDELNTLSYFTLQYNNANIQLLDLPGIIEGASQGKYVW